MASDILARILRIKPLLVLNLPEGDLPPPPSPLARPIDGFQEEPAMQGGGVLGAFVSLKRFLMMHTYVEVEL